MRYLRRNIFYGKIYISKILFIINENKMDGHN